jgi:hypothetical protein
MKSLGYVEYSPAMKPIQKAFQVCMSTNIITSENLREEPREMNLRALKGEVPCKRYITYEVRSVRKLFNREVYCHFLLVSSILTALKLPRASGFLGIRPHCE